MDSVRIVNVRVDVVGKEELNALLLQCVRENRQKVFSYINAHAVNLAKGDAGFRKLLEQSHVTYCDGEGVRIAARLLGVRLPPRVVLTYWIRELSAICVRERLSVFLLGGREEVVRKAVEVLRKEHPQINIVGWHSGYFEKVGEENDRIVKVIQMANPDILFVGFGMPMQERWIWDNLPSLPARAILPCGSMIDYTAGKKTFAPSWMSQNGLEWLYRLLQEPGRLWKRYILGNPIFVARVVMQRLREGRQA